MLPFVYRPARSPAAAGRSENPDSGWATEVVRDHHRLDSLAAEWDALYDSTPSATGFQSHAWSSAWARAYVPGGGLRVSLVRWLGRLVAAAPLHVVQRGPWPVLVPLGDPITDLTDILIAGDVPTAQAGELLRSALTAEPGWRLIDVSEARPGSVIIDWADSWPGRVRHVPGSVCLELPARPLPDVLTSMPRRAAKRVRKHLRKVDELDLAVRTVAADEARDGVAALLRLHEAQWRGRGITSEHLSRRFADFLTRAVPVMVRNDQAALVEYRVDDQLVVSQLHVLGHRLIGAYMCGIAPELRARIDVTTMMIRFDLGLAAAAGVESYSMLRGDEPYKQQWYPRTVHNRRLLLPRPDRWGAAGLPLLICGRAQAARLANEHAPWVGNLRARIRSYRAQGQGLPQ
jgi:CelD/BcsL family acetyltransferase involved in cellulose biosynthesis